MTCMMFVVTVAVAVVCVGGGIGATEVVGGLMRASTDREMRWADGEFGADVAVRLTTVSLGYDVASACAAGGNGDEAAGAPNKVPRGTWRKRAGVSRAAA